MTLHTSRLTLRPLRADDLDALHAIYCDPDAMRFWDRPPHRDKAATRDMLEKLMRHAPDEHVEYGVEHNGHLIGRLGMWRRFEIGYIFAPGVWGQGFASEALAAFLPALFDRFPETCAICAEIDPRNAASDRLLRKLGFSRVGYAEQNFLYGGTDWTDSAYYRLDRPALRPLP